MLFLVVRLLVPTVLSHWAEARQGVLGSEVMDGRVLCIKILSCLLDFARIAAGRVLV